MKHDSIVYLIFAQVEGVGQWKIGYTTRRAVNRIKEMKTSNPNIVGVEAEYKVFGSHGRQIESVMKRYYNSHLIEGEWFRFEALNGAEFLNKCAQIDNNIKVIKQHSTLI